MTSASSSVDDRCSDPDKLITAPGARAQRFDWARQLFRPIDILPLVCFRVFFGAMMIYHTWSAAHDGWIEFFYVRPEFHLTFPGFGWVSPWPGAGMYVHFAVMGLAAAGIMLGLFYRCCTVVFWLGFTYVFLLEKALYQNHYYLICLLSFLMIFLPAHRACSFDALRQPALRTQFVPAWTLWLLRFQLAIPYFYGGLAKLNYDWLHAQPMTLWLARRTHLPVIGPWLTGDAMPYVFAWGGVLFDLLIVPALLWKRTRPLAYLAAVVFHLMNAVLWDIGIFPWFMIGATLLFFPPELFRRVLSRRRLRAPAEPQPTAALDRRQRLTVRCLMIYAAWQLLFPFRHFLYPGDVNWTEEGHHFAWHMMLREKDVGLRVYIHDRATGADGLLNLREFVNSRQLSRLGKDPDMVLEFVHFVRDHYHKHQGSDLEIRVLNIASLNGRKPQLLMDPHRDYAHTPRIWGPQPWIVPLTEPLRAEGWNVPLEQWEQVLHLDLPELMQTNRSQRIDVIEDSASNE